MVCEALRIEANVSFGFDFRWMLDELLARDITLISQGVSTLIDCAVAHGIPEGWKVAVVSADGMEDINAEEWPPDPRRMHVATVVSTTAVRLNKVNSSDWPAYAGGGTLVWYAPASLQACSAEMVVRDARGRALFALTSDGDIQVDDTNKRLRARLGFEDPRAALWPKAAHYDLYVTDGSGFKENIATGEIRYEE